MVLKKANVTQKQTCTNNLNDTVTEN